jgi:hypothetical protein
MTHGVARQFLESAFCAIITNIPLFFLWLPGRMLRSRAAFGRPGGEALPLRAKIQQGLRAAGYMSAC